MPRKRRNLPGEIQACPLSFVLLLLSWLSSGMMVFSKPLHLILYKSPFAVVTNYHKVNGLKTTQMYSITVLGGQKSKMTLSWVRPSHWQVALFLESLAENWFPCPFQRLEATYIPCLAVPSSTSKACSHSTDLTRLPLSHLLLWFSCLPLVHLKEPCNFIRSTLTIQGSFLIFRAAD